MSVASALRSKNAEEFVRPVGVTEENWKSRFGFCSTLADAIETDGKITSPTSFEPYLNGISECVISERTTLSNSACRLCGVLPKVMGVQIHMHLDRLLPALIRQCANTKTVAQKAASAAITSMILNTPYHHRFLYHVCQTFEDKYTGPKLYAPLWLKTIIENYPLALNPDRDYDTILRAISAGLEEADINVRVNNRACFWAFHKINPAGAEEVMNKLNPHAKTALLNDPNNPDKSKSKSKKSEQDTASALAQLKKERMKQKAAERNRMANSTTVASEDIPTTALDIADDKHSRYPQKTPLIITPVTEVPSTLGKSASRPIAIHKKGFSHDGQVPTVTKKPSTMDIGTTSKKTGSAESLRTSQSKKPTSAPATETSTSRPLLSAPVRRPRIVATPINTQQSSSRPASRTGVSQTSITTADQTLKSAASHKELRSAPIEYTTSELPNTSFKQSKKTSAVIVPTGKENEFMSHVSFKLHDPSSPIKFNRPLERDPGPLSPPKHIIHKPDGVSAAQRIKNQEWDREIKEMLPHMAQMATIMHKQEDEKHTQMYRAYPGLNHDGQIDQARRAFDKALEYLNRDALDYMGFRKLRKLLEQFGIDLITDQALYDLLWSHLLPRIGTFDELLPQPIELNHEDHPRYIRSAVVAMVNILLQDYPAEWSYQYFGPALAALMMARCAYSANADLHEGATYLHNMSVVNQINLSIQIGIGSCINPIPTLDSVLQILAAGEDFLMQNAPHDSEHQTLQSWASFNPYSKLNRLRTEGDGGLLYEKPRNLDTFETADPKPLPMKLPLLMETGLKIIKALLWKAEREGDKLGEEKEDALAKLARHLMTSYNIIIRKQVMEYCQVLYKNFESEEKFWAYFTSDSERNLLHYYLERKG